MTHQPPPENQWQAPGGYQPPPAAGTPSAATSGLKPPLRSRTWFIIAVAVAALIVGAVIGGAGKSTNDAKASPAITTTTRTTATATATATATVRVTTMPTKIIATRTQQVRVTYTPPPPASFGDGTYVIGTDIQPGIYKTAGGGDGACGWTRMSDLSGDFDSIITNGIASGPTTVQIDPGDKAFKLEGGCNWSRIG